MRAPLHHRDLRNSFDFDAIDLDGFARAVKGLRAEIDASLGPDDLRHLRRIERWGRLATAVGLATAPIAPNPLSAAAILFVGTSRMRSLRPATSGGTASAHTRARCSCAPGDSPPHPLHTAETSA